jgi:hypothetical protein
MAKESEVRVGGYGVLGMSHIRTGTERRKELKIGRILLEQRLSDLLKVITIDLSYLIWCYPGTLAVRYPSLIFIRLFVWKPEVVHVRICIPQKLPYNHVQL